MTNQKDGLQGLVVLTGALLCQLIVGGISLSSGIFYVMYREAFNSTPVVTSWLCSLPATLWFMSAPLGSIMVNKFGYRLCSVVGGFIAATGLSLGFYANDILFLFFAYGIFTGIGFGINYTGSMAAVSSYFDKYRIFATGSMSIGHNLGLVILPFLIDFLAITYGWRGTLLILGGLTFNLCALSSLYRPIQEKQDQNGAKKPRPTFNLSVLKKSSFICFCVSNVLVNTGQGIYILHLPAYAKSIGFSPSDIGIVLTIYGLSNAVGKLCFSVLGQHPKVDVSITYAVSLTIAGICMGLAPVFLTRTGMMILPGFVGFFFCVTCAFLAAVILRIVGQDRFADGVGVVMPFKATGNLIGGPIAGYLSEKSGSYTSSFCLACITLFVAAAMMIYPIIYHRRQERAHLDVNINLVSEKVTASNVKTSAKLPKENKVIIKKSDTKEPLLSETA